MVDKDVLTTGEVARLLRVTTNTVVKWFEAGLLKGYTFPGTRTRRILRDSFEDFCRKRQIPIRRIQEEPFLTTGQCADACKVTVNTITKWVDKGLLHGFTIESDRRLVFLDDLKKFMQKNKMPLEQLDEHDSDNGNGGEKKKKPARPRKRTLKKKPDRKKRKTKSRKKKTKKRNYQK